MISGFRGLRRFRGSALPWFRGSGVPWSLATPGRFRGTLYHKVRPNTCIGIAGLHVRDRALGVELRQPFHREIGFARVDDLGIGGCQGGRGDLSDGDADLRRRPVDFARECLSDEMSQPAAYVSRSPGLRLPSQSRKEGETGNVLPTSARICARSMYSGATPRSSARCLSRRSWRLIDSSLVLRMPWALKRWFASCFADSIGWRTPRAQPG